MFSCVKEFEKKKNHNYAEKTLNVHKLRKKKMTDIAFKYFDVQS